MVLETDVQESHKSVVMPSRSSLSRRVAKLVVRMAQRFHSDILLTSGSVHIDAKSTLMAFILLDALKGQKVDVMARGQDSVLAVQNLSALFEQVK